MRYNAFNEGYALSPDDINRLLDIAGVEPSSVHADAPYSDGKGSYTSEIRTNHDGDTVGYIEAATEAKIRAWLDECGIEVV